MKALLLFYKQENRYSLNALLGAIEDFLAERKDITIYFFKTPKELLNGVQQISDAFNEVIFLLSFLTPQYWDLKALLLKLRSLKIKSKLTLITGGPHASAFPKETLALGFDYVFVGEAEESFSTFLKSYVEENNPYPSIKGVAYFKNGEYYSLGKTNPVDLNKYTPFSLKFSKVGPIEITRGCPFVCKYCQTLRLFGTKIRHRSIETILNYGEALLKRGIRDLRFITPNAFSYGSIDGKKFNLEALRTLLQELHSLTKIYGGRNLLWNFSFIGKTRACH